MTAIEDPRFGRLPKWAQQEIARLAGTVEYLRAELATGPDDSDTFVEDYQDKGRPLGQGPGIRFDVDDRVYFEAKLRAGVLTVRGSDSIAVAPQSGNVVRVRVVGLGW